MAMPSGSRGVLGCLSGISLVDESHANVLSYRGMSLSVLHAHLPPVLLIGNAHV